MKENRESIIEYASLVPGEIRRALQALSKDREIAILVLLIKKGGLAFSEIKGELDVHQQKLTTSLNQMQDAGIVVRKDTIDGESKYKTQYQVTKYGKRVLDNLFDAIEPREDQSTIMFFEESAEEERPAAEFFNNVNTTDKTRAVETQLEDAKQVNDLQGAGEPRQVNP